MEEEDPENDGRDLEPGVELVSGAEHLAGKGLCNSEAWWVIIHEAVLVRRSPSLQGGKVAVLCRGKLVYVLSVEQAWVRISTSEVPKSVAAQRVPNFIACKGQEMWMMWDGKEVGLGVLLRPMAHLLALSKYRSSDMKLPRDALGWSVDEVEVYLGSSGSVKPSRQSALMRNNKRLVRSVRGGVCGLEFRVDETGKQGGIFADETIPANTCVEICPLLETKINAQLCKKSSVLQRITVKMENSRNRFAIVLGYGKLYTSSPSPNLNWSYQPDDQVLLWAPEEITFGSELTVDFSAPPRPAQEAPPMPSKYSPPPERPGKLAEAGYIIYGKSLIHGWGVYTTKDVKAGQLLECAPAVVLDEAGAEALFDYRWGLKDDRDDGKYYFPLGYGGLYNHSDQNVARGCLDVKRGVLEFYSTKPILKGQEVFVTYGDKYFDEDFAGHRKSEVQQLAMVESHGDSEMHKIIELQRALIHCFSSEDFGRQMKLFHRERAANSLKVKQAGEGKVKNALQLQLEFQLPILERYGYDRTREGSNMMLEDLWKRTADVDVESEAGKNNQHMQTLLGHGREPAVPFRETMELELTILGTQDLDYMESGVETVILRAVPRRAPCSYVYFVLRNHVFKDCPLLKLVQQRGSTWVVLKEMEAIPTEEPIYMAGVGDFVPKTLKAQIPRDSSPEALIDTRLQEWEVLSHWLAQLGGSPSAGLWKMVNFWTYGNFDFIKSTFKIHGTWDDFKGNEMQWSGGAYVYIATLGKEGHDSFQIVMDDDWGKTIYPNIKDANPFASFTMMGPDGKGHGFNWTLGRHELDWGQPGHKYQIELRLNPYGGLDKVYWSCLGLGIQGEEEKLAAEIEVAAEKRAQEWHMEEQEKIRLDEELETENEARWVRLKYGGQKYGGQNSLLQDLAPPPPKPEPVPEETAATDAEPETKPTEEEGHTSSTESDTVLLDKSVDLQEESNVEAGDAVDSEDIDLMEALGLIRTH